MLMLNNGYALIAEKSKLWLKVGRRRRRRRRRVKVVPRAAADFVRQLTIASLEGLVYLHIKYIVEIMEFQ